MKHFKLLIITIIISLTVSCSSTKKINGIFINLDNTSQNIGYIADIRGDGEPIRIQINEEGKFDFNAPKKDKTLVFQIQNSTRGPVGSKSARITDKTKHIITLNNGIEFYQKIIVVEKGEDFNKIYDTAVKNYKQLDKEKAKVIKGLFVNLGDKSKKFCFNIFGITSDLYNPINDEGEFSFKYPKNTNEKYQLTIDNNDPFKTGDVYMKKDIPADTEQVIVFFDGVKKQMIFVTKGENYNKKYNTALEDFQKVSELKKDHTPIYPGCEKNAVEDYAKCFNDKIMKHIKKYFDSNLANSLGLSSGKKRINALIEVDEKGNTNIISVKAPHPKLEKEIISVFKRLPLIKSAIENNNPIKTQYRFPINFIVD